LIELLQQFRQRLDDPLLALPDPKVVRRYLFSASRRSARRSVRLAAKAKGLPASVVKRAQRLLMVKLDIYREEDRLSEAQLKEYTVIFVSPLGSEQISAIAALFGLTCTADSEDLLVDASAA
jgi:hypothetical protein